MVQPGLVDHHVLARAHRLDGKVRTVPRDRGDDDKRNVRTVQQGATVRDLRKVGKTFDETGLGFGRALRPPADAVRARRDQVFRHPVGVPMVDADNSEFQAHDPLKLLYENCCPVSADTFIAWISSCAASAPRPVIAGVRPAITAVAKSSSTEACQSWVKAMGSAPPPVVAVAPWVSVRPSRHSTRSTPSARRRLAFFEMERDAFRRAGETGGGGGEPPQRAAFETQSGHRHVLGLHPVQRRRSGHGGHGADRAGQAQREVDGVDRLRDQDAAAIARVGAAPRLVVIGLFPPPWHRDLGQAERAQRRPRRQGPSRRRTPPASGAGTRRQAAPSPLHRAQRTSCASSNVRPTGFSRRMALPARANGSITARRASGGVRTSAISDPVVPGNLLKILGDPDLVAQNLRRVIGKTARAPGVPRQDRDQAQRNPRIPDRQEMGTRHHARADHRDAQWSGVWCHRLISPSRWPQRCPRIVASSLVRYSGANRAERQYRADLIDARDVPGCAVSRTGRGSADGAADPRGDEVRHSVAGAAARNARLGGRDRRALRGQPHARARGR